MNIGDVLGSDAFKNAASALGPIGSLIGGLFQSNSQKKINEMNIALQRETNALQEKMFHENLDWQKESQQMQNEYNSLAKQVERASEAGFSPGAVLGGAGATPASTGSVGVGVPALQAPRAQMIDSVPTNMISNFSQIAGALSDISSSMLDDSKKNEITTLLTDRLKGLQLDNDAKVFSLKMAYKFSDKYKQAEYDYLVAKNATEISQVRLNDELTETQKYEQINKISDSMLKDSQRFLNRKEYDIFEQKWNLQKEEINSKIKLNASSARLKNVQADDTIATRQYRINVLSSEAILNMANSELSKEQANQIRALTPLIEESYKLANKEKTFTNNVLPQKLKNELQQQYNDLKRQGLINQQEQQRLEMLQKENNLYYYKELVGMFTDIAGAASQFMPYAFPKLSSNIGNVQVQSTQIPFENKPVNPIGFR